MSAIDELMEHYATAIDRLRAELEATRRALTSTSNQLDDAKTAISHVCSAAQKARSSGNVWDMEDLTDLIDQCREYFAE